MGSKSEPLLQGLLGAFLEPSREPPGPSWSSLKRPDVPKTLQNSSPNACAQKRVLAAGDLPWTTFQSHLSSFLAFVEWVQKAHLRKEDLEDLMIKGKPAKTAAEHTGNQSSCEDAGPPPMDEMNPYRSAMGQP